MPDAQERRQESPAGVHYQLRWRYISGSIAAPLVAPAGGTLARTVKLLKSGASAIADDPMLMMPQLVNASGASGATPGLAVPFEAVGATPA